MPGAPRDGRNGETCVNRENGGIDDLRIDRNEGEGRRTSAGAVVVWVVAAAVATAAAVWFHSARTPRVRTVTARETAAESGGPRTVLHASGYVVARRQATVSSKITGKVVEVLVEEGMRVEEGQILARLDDSNVRAGLGLAESELAATGTAREETRVRLDEAQTEFRRIEQLASAELATASELDRARAEVKALEARLAQQESQVLVAKQQVAVWTQQVEDAVIRAPFSGIAVSKNAQPGEMISPISAGGGFTRTGIGTIVDMDSLEIEVDVNESYLIRVRPGQPVVATLDAYPEWAIPCKVLAIIPTADRQKSTVKVRVKFDRLDPRILPDMGVKVAFQGTPDDAPAARAVLLPEAAVRRDAGRATAWVVEEGRARLRDLTVETAGAGTVTVTAGVKPGERVIVGAPATIKEGRRVREDKP